MISVIVPVYNAEKYLEHCVQSILDQTYRDLEVILVNDGSKDGSLELCRRLALADERVIVLDGPNGGVASARNRGLDQARGEYVAFVDSDDWLAPDMYERLLAVLEEKDADIAECGAWFVPENGDAAEKVAPQPMLLEGTEACLAQYADVRTSFQCPWNKLFRRSVIGDVRYPPYALGEDALFNGRVLLNTRKKILIEDCLYYYLLRGNGLSVSTRPGTELDGTRALDALYRLCREHTGADLCDLARRICDLALARLREGMKTKRPGWPSIRQELKRTYIAYYPKTFAPGKALTARQKLGFALFRLSPEQYIRYNEERN